MNNKSKTIVGVVIGVLVVALIAALVWVFAIKPNQDDKASVANSTSDTTGLQTLKGDPSTSNPVKPDNFADDGGILISKDGINKKIDGIPTYELYASPICPFCGAIERASGEATMKLVKEGKINYILHPVVIGWMDRFSYISGYGSTGSSSGSSPTDHYATRAASAAIYIGANDPDHFFDFIEYIYQNNIQPEEGQNYKHISDEQIQQWAKAAGVKEDVAKNCTSGKYTSWAEKTYEDMNLNSIPVLKSNGHEFNYGNIITQGTMDSDLRAVLKPVSAETMYSVIEQFKDQADTSSTVASN
ncbi:MAG: DsbA family protein [Candidatus Ancillula sp.]|jgi:protein-disulfide isomerase|nr:DsbA family protein [Candidatus Ancillula sp.]